MARDVLRAMLTWIALEFLVRNGGTIILAWPLPAPSERLIVASFVGMAAAMAVLGVVFVRRARHAGMTPRLMGYRASWPVAAAGGGGGVLLLAVLEMTGRLDDAILPDPGVVDSYLRALRAGGSFGVGSLVAGNVVGAPLVEELAWRGYMQTKLSQALVPWQAVAVTAAGFAVKHMVVDLSVSRASTLCAASLILCLLRWRFGTTASTLAHVVMNGVATAGLIAEALGIPTLPL